MNRKIAVELLEKCDAVTFYTVRFTDEQETEYDKFFQKFDDSPVYGEDFNVIIEWLNTIADKGALERYFRPEGGKLKALPIETGKLRLFGIRISDCIFIIGNGGAKRTQKYQEDPILNRIAEDLKQVAGHLQNRVNNEKVNIYNCELYGNLEFAIES